MQEAELTYIEGTVDAVIYQNRENGYTVLRLDAGEGRGLTVVGSKLSFTTDYTGLYR